MRKAEILSMSAYYVCILYMKYAMSVKKEIKIGNSRKVLINCICRLKAK